MRNLIRTWLGLPPAPSMSAAARSRSIDDVLMHNTQAVYEAYLIDNGFLLRIRDNDNRPTVSPDLPAILYCKDISEVCDALVRDATMKKISGNNKPAQLNLPLSGGYAGATPMKPTK